MVFLGNIIHAIAWILDNLLTLYSFVVIGSALLSWVNPDPYNPIVRFMRNLTEPAYYYIKKYIPFVFMGGFDLSPIVLLLVIQFCKLAVIRNLDHLAYIFLTM